MAGCDEIRVSAVSRAHLEAFLNQGAKMGTPVPDNHADSGETKQDGVTVQWEYLPEKQTLVVRCTDAPALYPCSMINTRIQEVIASVMKQDTISAKQA